MSRGVKRFADLQAWRACDVYKKAIYRLCDVGPIARDLERRKQLEESACRSTSYIAEGFGRFNPPDFGRFYVIARSSLMESQNQLRDAVDKKYITEECRVEHDKLAETAVEEVTGLMEYRQSPEAFRNARRARERRIASRPERKGKNEQRTKTHEPGTEPEIEHERRSEKPEE